MSEVDYPCVTNAVEKRAVRERESERKETRLYQAEWFLGGVKLRRMLENIAECSYER